MDRQQYPAMTVYETISHEQIRIWCEGNGYWPGCALGQPDRIRVGGGDFAEPEAMDLLDWEDWFVQFDRRQLKFVYDPTQGWYDLQSRNVRPD
jgi:hypothetical protein